MSGKYSQGYRSEGRKKSGGKSTGRDLRPRPAIGSMIELELFRIDQGPDHIFIASTNIV